MAEGEGEVLSEEEQHKRKKEVRQGESGEAKPSSKVTNPTMVEEGHETEEPSEEVHEKVESLGEEVVVGVELKQSKEKEKSQYAFGLNDRGQIKTNPLKVAEEHATEEALVEF